MFTQAHPRLCCDAKATHPSKSREARVLFLEIRRGDHPHSIWGVVHAAKALSNPEEPLCHP